MQCAVNPAQMMIWPVDRQDTWYRRTEVLSRKKDNDGENDEYCEYCKYMKSRLAEMMSAMYNVK